MSLYETDKIGVLSMMTQAASAVIIFSATLISKDAQENPKVWLIVSLSLIVIAIQIYINYTISVKNMILNKEFRELKSDTSGYAAILEGVNNKIDNLNSSLNAHSAIVDEAKPETEVLISNSQKSGDTPQTTNEEKKDGNNSPLPTV